MNSNNVPKGAKVAVIAGATRGIGLALVRALAQAWGGTGSVYMTARRPADGEAVTAALAGEGLKIHWLAFDLADPASAARLAASLAERHGRLDIAVLNGGYAPRAGAPASADARAMIAANNHGTLAFLRAMAPMLAENARLVVVASAMGVLANVPPKLRPLFDTSRQTPDAIDAAMDAYVAAAEAGTAVSDGWPAWVNVPSKVGQVAVTRAFAREFASSPTRPAGVLVNAACPGLTLTDATRDFMDTVFKGRPVQTPEEAARDLLWLVTLPPGTTSPYAELVQHRRILPFGD